MFALCKKLGWKPKDNDDAVEMFAKKVEEMNDFLNIPATIKDYGIKEKDFLEKVDTLSDLAFGDQCTTANPRLPLVKELKELYLTAYYGKSGK